MGATGLELPPKPPRKPGVSTSTGADSGARNDDPALPTPPGTCSDAPASPHPDPEPDAPTDPDLHAVVAAWPDLPPAIRAGVLALVRAAVPGGGDEPARRTRAGVAAR
ncbi:MAG: hypothetical protein SFY69_13360 [Planctomycetota bacterium]|nr:hypothetical protein [Planctomycetota bacterium]